MYATTTGSATWACVNFTTSLTPPEKAGADWAGSRVWVASATGRVAVSTAHRVMRERLRVFMIRVVVRRVGGGSTRQVRPGGMVSQGGSAIPFLTAPPRLRGEPGFRPETKAASMTGGRFRFQGRFRLR